MTLRITRDDRVPEGLLQGFPYQEIREQEERQSASTRWPLLAAVDRQIQEARQREFLRHRSGGIALDDTVDDPTVPTFDDDPVPAAQGSKPRRG